MALKTIYHKQRTSTQLNFSNIDLYQSMDSLFMSMIVHFVQPFMNHFY